MEVFLELVKVGGLAFALAALALLALLRGDVITKKSHEAIVNELRAQIQREEDGRAELWEIVRPALGVARESLNKLESERTEKGGRR